MYLLAPKMHKIPSVAMFIVTGKKCINKQLSKHVTLVFRLCYSQVGAYYKKHFCGTKTLWVLGINSLPLEYVNKICKRKNAKQISAFDFSTYVRRYLLINCSIFYIEL